MLTAMLDFGLLLHASLPNSYLDRYCDEQYSIPAGRYRSKLSAAVMLIYRLPCWLFFAALVVAPIGEACALNDPSGAVSAHERSTPPIAHGVTLEFASLPAATAKDPDTQGGDEHWPDRLVQRSLSVFSHVERGCPTTENTCGALTGIGRAQPRPPAPPSIPRDCIGPTLVPPMEASIPPSVAWKSER